MTNVTEQGVVNIYDFERDGETKYGFVLTFVKQNEVYTPFITNSQDAIGCFIDPIEYAEHIQDIGSKYIITPNAIIFDDHASAALAADELLSEIARQPIESTARILYNFAKERYFGKKQKIAEDLATRCDLPVEQITETELQHELATLVAIAEGTLVAHHGEKDYSIFDYHVATGSLMATDGTVLDVADCDLTY